jgi:hypothetical protein
MKKLINKQNILQLVESIVIPPSNVFGHNLYYPKQQSYKKITKPEESKELNKVNLSIEKPVALPIDNPTNSIDNRAQLMKYKLQLAGLKGLAIPNTTPYNSN